MAEKHHLLLTFKSRRAFLDAYVETGPHGGLYVKDRPHLSPGDPIDLEIVLADDLMVFHSRAQVVERQAPRDPSQPTLMRIDFLPSEDETRRVLLNYAKGKDRFTVQRRQRRFPIQIQLEYAIEADFQPVLTYDLNENGAFMLSDVLPPAGTLIAIRFPTRGRGAAPLTINAEVAWLKRRTPRGFGVRFLVGDPSKQQLVRQMVGHLLQEQLATE